jgi:hypothetical protein
MNSHKILVFCTFFCIVVLSTCFSPWSPETLKNVVYTVTLTDGEKQKEVISTANPIVVTVPKGEWKVEIEAEATDPESSWSTFSKSRPKFWGEIKKISVDEENEKITIDTSAMSPSIQVDSWEQLSNAFNGKWDKFLREIGWKPTGKPQKYYVELLEGGDTNNTSATLNGDSNKNVVLWADKNKVVTIKRANGLVKPLFQIEKGTLTLGRADLEKDEQGTLTQGTITIDGDRASTTSNDSLITVFGTLIMYEGVTITNNKKTVNPFSTLSDKDPKSDRNLGGGGVYVGKNGIFIMHGGKISGNSTSDNGHGGGIRVRGTFTMINGEISDNTSHFGGGVRVSTTGTFTMHAGEISSNTANSRISNNETIKGNGGGVSTGNIFTMRGGKIILNKAGTTSGSGSTTTGDGGGVFVDALDKIENLTGGTFTMRGGEISRNTINGGYGTGVYVGKDGKFSRDIAETTISSDDIYPPQ